MSTVVIAEKPSVARSIADAIGARSKGSGALRGNGYVVTWALGHLVGIAEPHEMVPSWRAWRQELLPMLPKAWLLKVIEATRSHFLHVESLLNAPEVDAIVCATDAGREGELIFRYIYQKAGCTKPVRRLWISSLTPDAIRTGFRNLRPLAHFDRLAAAAEARSRADWLVGMNFSRAYTLRFGPDLLSVGRVQTPTLAMVVERERAIRTFVPEKYYEVRATFGSDADRYVGVWFRPPKTKQDAEETLSRLPPDGVVAEEIRARCEGQRGRVVEAVGSEKSFAPPFLYDLTELQRHANRLYGMTAQATLRAAQSLYEEHKLLSYPRTDSRHISEAIAATLPAIADALVPFYRDMIAPGTGERPLSKRFVDDAKVTDHHAIIPTGLSRARKRLTSDEEKIYDLVSRRLLMAWHPDHKTRVTRVVTWVPAEAKPGQPVDLFRSSGTVVTQVGWKVLDVRARRPGGQEGNGEPRLPDGLAVGQVRAISAIEALEKQTSPPPPLTDALLLTAMESAGRTLDSRELEEAMRDRGLGTPATRAAILETLIARGYVERKGKALRATEKGIALIDVVHESVKSPQLTGEWELELKKLERGEGAFDRLMAKVERFVIEVIGAVQRSPPKPPAVFPASHPRVGPSSSESDSQGPFDGRATAAKRPLHVSVTPGEDRAADVRQAPVAPDLAAILHERFQYEAFRPNQENVCRAVTAGHDALLVMPTGSGKSLCYQLPGVARGGTTLVISPLIALMEDQCAKLCQKGFRADRIHSGRTRDDSRAACREYLEGSLHFLMIAPERLSVPGFPAMLARRKPTLIAIDEAHCISQWGHDFRPDYRLIGKHLPVLRPSPILALTATATPRVQDDIVAQLAIPEADRFVQGFRRHNLAIEVIDCPRGERLSRALAILQQKKCRPAIVYVPSRKMAEQVAAALSAARVAAAPYHAGLDAEVRERTQRAFQLGHVDVVVATIAFGMGIDKANIRTVIHLALPGTLESYYQEIGRAGRDGEPARAVLYYSWGDRKMHESFLERDYPIVTVLESLLGKVPASGIDRSALLAASGLDDRTSEPALGKLRIHGAVTINEDDTVRPVEGANSRWRMSYESIRQHRLGQLEDMVSFARAGGCRMVGLVRHFGETRDTKPCGLCDDCEPCQCIAHSVRLATADEVALSRRIIEELRRWDGCSVGTLRTRLDPVGKLERSELEHVLGGLARDGRVVLIDDEFEKDGRTIPFRRVRLGPKHTAVDPTVPALLQRGNGSEKGRHPSVQVRRRVNDDGTGRAKSNASHRRRRKRGRKGERGGDEKSPATRNGPRGGKAE